MGAPGATLAPGGDVATLALGATLAPGGDVSTLAPGYPSYHTGGDGNNADGTILATIMEDNTLAQQLTEAAEGNDATATICFPETSTIFADSVPDLHATAAIPDYPAQPDSTLMDVPPVSPNLPGQIVTP